MTNLEVLIWGVKHIAENHGFRSCVDWEEDGEVAICGNNVPTLMDAIMLCEDVKIPRSFVESNQYGIDIYIPQDWLEEEANKEYFGLSFWKKLDAKIER